MKENVECRCSYCSSLVFVNKKLFREKRNQNKKYFCSRTCSDLFNGRLTQFKCGYCGNTSTKPTHDYLKSSRHFCSKQCSCKQIGSENAWDESKRLEWSIRAKNLFLEREEKEKKIKPKGLENQIKKWADGLRFCKGCSDWFKGYKGHYCCLPCFCKNAELGGLRENSTKVHRTLYKGQKMNSGAEALFAHILEENNIIWVKNTTQYFHYSYEGKLKKYYPDFYLSDLDIWVEIKGKRYIEKWLPEKLEAVERAGYKIHLIMSEELKNTKEIMAKVTGLEPAY